MGKTTLARSCLADTGGIYLDLESQRDLSKLADPEDYLSQRESQLVVLDEIQRVPDLFPSLRSLIDDGRTRGLRAGRFLLLGSASLELIQQSSETLAGRIAYLELFIRSTPRKSAARRWNGCGCAAGFPTAISRNLTPSARSTATS